MLLDRNAILDAQDLRTLDVPAPEWGGDVRLRELTGLERAEYDALGVVRQGDDVHVDMRRWQVRLVAMSLVTPEGHRMFDASEVELLGAKSGVALGRIAAAAARLNGMGVQAAEGVEKNSDGSSGAAS